MNNSNDLIGSFIAIPAWHVEGMVTKVRPADFGGTDAAISVLLEVEPDDPAPRWYRLEPHEYVVLDGGACTD